MRLAPATERRRWGAQAPAILLAALAACATPAAKPAPAAAVARDASTDALAPARVARLRAYIRDAWQPLTRTLADLPRAAEDPKIPHAPGAPWPVYLPADENRDAVAAALARALPARDLARLALRPLPLDNAVLRPNFPHGLLYLPRPYVVPGGRFNEMYGWDSSFIVLGLLRDGRVDLARDIADDFIYEVRHYGAVLNANRTYYLTRSQPPLLSGMVLAVYRATGDRAWLAAARGALVADHEYWTSPPHRVSAVLSRYFDRAASPAPEVVMGERDAQGRNHYDRVRAWFRAHPEAAADSYRAATDELTVHFYGGDRAMRESGFDPTGRFGPFGADTTRYEPVCLNSLLYKMEIDLAEIDETLGQGEAKQWRARAEERRAVVESLMWDDEAGLYFDYDLERARPHPYPFATTFWPLWAGLASPAHAKRVRDNLRMFERPGGIMTSTVVTGAQWDAPFGWAPLQLFAVRGLRRYGFRADADRIARAWLSMLVENFERRGTLVEKYDVERRTSDVAGRLAFGYTSNEVGFGWTNGVALELMTDLHLNASK
jgi:alpha,alpha-trehalase